MARRVPLYVLAVSLLGFGCAPPPPPPGPVRDAPEDIAALNAVRAGFIAAYKAGDAQAIANLYTEDAISEPNNQATLEGRQAIVDSLTSMFELVSVNVDLVPDETTTLGEVGLDRGHYTVVVTPKAEDATPTTAEGRYLVVLVKMPDGSWKVARDIDNAGAPPMPPAEPEGTGSGSNDQ